MDNHPLITDKMTNRIRTGLLATIPWILAVMTAGVLALNFPDGDLVRGHAVDAVVYAFLTAFVLFFGVWLSEDELSPAHVVGLVAFLSLPQTALPVLVWAIFAGGFIGAVALIARERYANRSLRQYIYHVIFLTARVSLSFFAASQVYIAVEGPLPLQSATWTADPNTISTLVTYVLVYITLYFSIFLLEIYVNGRPIDEIIHGNLSLILVIMLLPVPFAVLSAEVSNSFSMPAEVISLLGLVLIALWLHALSRSDYQLRKQVNELQTLSVITRAMRSHLDLEMLLKTVYTQVSELMDVHNFTVALHNEDSDRLEFPLVMRWGQEAAGDSTSRANMHSSSLIEYVFNSGMPLLIRDDVQTAARARQLEPPAEGVYSWVGAPLVAGGRPLGVIAVHSERPNQHFGADELRLLNIVSASASIAIENAKLYRQQSERLEQMETLNKIAALLSGTLSPDTVLDIVISSASAISQSSAVAVYLFWDETRDELPLARSAGLSRKFTDNPPAPLLGADNGLSPHEKKPVAISNIADDDRTSHIADLLKHENKRALVELPLVIGERSLGILVVYFEDMQVFRSEELELLRSFATQAAQAINNAHTFTTTDEAFQRSVEQLMALTGIGRQLTATMDLTEISDIILDHVTEATHIDVGAVILYNEERTKLQVMAQRGYPEGTFDDPAVVETGLSQEVFSSGQIRRVDDVSQVDNYKRLANFTRSQLSVPILRGREVIGVITLESPKLGGFSSEDSHFVMQIANQAVIAIDNARLFKRITEARDRLQVILNAMDEGLILVDSNGKIALANPRIDLVGLHPESLINRQVLELADDQSLRLVNRLGFGSKQEIERFVQTLSKRAAWSSHNPHTYTLQKEQGACYIERSIVPVPDEQGNPIGALLVFYDKTEEQELDHAREQLSRMIVHDLRSPLTAVTTSLKLLQELVPADSDFHSVVFKTTDASRRAIRKLLARVDSLLDISKMESGRLGVETELVALPHLVESVRTELNPLAQELEVTITSEIPDDVPLLDVDADKVERLLLNLVDNALKYSPAESSVFLRSYSPGTSGAKDGYVRVDVVDNGPGIPDDYKEKLFESYVQVEGRRRVRRGVGLGLTFCKLAVEAHGGRIWIEDNPGGGSVFAFTLPVSGAGRLPEDEDEYPISSRE